MANEYGPIAKNVSNVIMKVIGVEEPTDLKGWLEFALKLVAGYKRFSNLL